MSLPPPDLPPAVAGPAAYPASFEIDAPLELARWRPLVQWILAIPHAVIAYAFSFLGSAVAVISWFVILFTGKLPQGLANLQIMVQRYRTRVQSYSGFLFADYPPFEFGSSPTDPGGSPAIVWFEPELEGRNRLTVGFRIILAIPVAVVYVLVSIAAAVVWFIAFFAIIFTGRWPEGMRSFVVRVTRFGIQVGAYVGLLTDRYPPFTLD